MVNKYYLPAISKFSNFLIDVIKNKKELGIVAGYESDTLNKVSAASNEIYKLKVELEKLLVKKNEIADIVELSMYLKTNVLAKMEEIRDAVDKIEPIVSKEYWPFISYGDILYSVK